MKPLTNKQQAVLDYIKTYTAERGFPPTVCDITSAFGWRSENSASEHLARLQKKGVIKVARGVARGITVVGQEKEPGYEEMASALRVISTWAAYDKEHGGVRALVPDDVLNLCNKALPAIDV